MDMENNTNIVYLFSLSSGWFTAEIKLLYKINIIVFRSTPFGSNRIVEFAKHLSCCWLERAPKRRIAGYDKRKQLWLER